MAASALQASAINTAKANLIGKIFINPASGIGFQTAAPSWNVRQAQKARMAAAFEANVASNFELMMR